MRYWDTLKYFIKVKCINSDRLQIFWWDKKHQIGRKFKRNFNHWKAASLITYGDTGHIVGGYLLLFRPISWHDADDIAKYWIEYWRVLKITQPEGQVERALYRAPQSSTIKCQPYWHWWCANPVQLRLSFLFWRTTNSRRD